MSGAGAAKVEVAPQIADIPAEAWDACANPDPAIFNPFVAHAFLKALEDAGTVGGRTGWTPRHLVLKARRRDRRLRAVLPESRTARASTCSTTAGRTPTCRRAGDYYPKLQIAVPFTPVPGRRLLIRPGPPAKRTRAMLAAGAVEIAERNRHIGRAHHVSERGRMEPPRRPRLPAAHRPAVPLEQRRLRARSTTTWPRSPRASARPCARSASRRWRRASRSNGCAAARSRKRTGTRSSRSIWRPARASGAGPISTASSSRCSAPAPWASAAC